MLNKYQLHFPKSFGMIKTRNQDVVGDTEQMKNSNPFQFR